MTMRRFTNISVSSSAKPEKIKTNLLVLEGTE
jgi:hypothetical protein